MKDLIERANDLSPCYHESSLSSNIDAEKWIYDACKEITALREELSLWKEINRDELAETFRLMEALGVVEEVESGTSCMDAMLGKIAALREALRLAGKELHGWRNAYETLRSVKMSLYVGNKAITLGESLAMRVPVESMRTTNANPLAAAAVREANEKEQA